MHRSDKQEESLVVNGVYPPSLKVSKGFFFFF